MEDSNSFETKLAIREVLDKYCDGVNQRDSEIWGSTWSKNAIWEIPHLEIKNEGNHETKKNYIVSFDNAIYSVDPSTGIFL